jgi:hypothetical protein
MARWAAVATAAEETSTTSNSVWSTHVTLTQTPPTGSKDYWIFWSCDTQVNNASADVQAELYDSTGAVTLAATNWEAREASSPIDWRSFGGFVKWTSPSSPVSNSWILRVKSETSGNTSKLRNGKIIIVESNAADQYAADATRRTTASSTWSDQLSLTFSPATTGDYLLIGYANTDSSTTADTVGVRLLDSDGSTAWFDDGTTPKDAANVLTWNALVYKASVTTGSKTFKIQYSSLNNSATTGIQKAALLALRLDAGFSETNQTVLASNNSGTDTTAATVLTLTWTATANKYLVLAAALCEGNSNTISVEFSLLEDSTTLGAPYWESNAASSAASCFFADLWTPSAGSHSIYLKRKSETSSVTALVNANAAIVALRTEDVGPVGSASITLEAATVSAASTVALAGAAAVTLAAATSSAAATVDIASAAAVTLADATTTATGAVAIACAAAITLADATVSAESVIGAAPISGEAAITLADATTSAAATIAIAGASAVALGDVTTTAAGALAIAGVAAVTLDGATVAATAMAPIAGAVAVPLADATATAAATLALAGECAVTLDDATATAAGTVDIAAAAAITLEDATVTAAGESNSISGVAAVTLDDATAEAAAAIAIAGVASVVLDDATTFAAAMRQVLVSPEELAALRARPSGGGGRRRTDASELARLRRLLAEADAAAADAATRREHLERELAASASRLTAMAAGQARIVAALDAALAEAALLRRRLSEAETDLAASRATARRWRGEAELLWMGVA